MNLNLKLHLFLKVLNNHVPVKQIKIKGRAHRFIIYNKYIKQLINQRDKKLKRFKLSHHIQDWEVHEGLRNFVKVSLRIAESNYIRNQIEKYKENSRSMWKVIRGCLPEKESSKPFYKKDHNLLAE